MGQRILSGIATLSLVVAVSAQAQGAWEPELGIRAGWTNVKIDGAPDAINFIDFPGGVQLLSSVAAGRAPLFAVIPVSDKFAVSPEFGFNELSASGSATLWQAGVTADYAITSKFYAGAGASLFFLRSSSFEQAQGGYQAKAGYRIHLARLLRLRLEAFFNGRPKTNHLPQSNAFGVSLGVSTVLK
ncbi:MAG: hypothetical protein ACHQXA_05030 [Gemmatimonadales bacterium]